MYECFTTDFFSCNAPGWSITPSLVTSGTSTAAAAAACFYLITAKPPPAIPSGNFPAISVGIKGGTIHTFFRLLVCLGLQTAAGKRKVLLEIDNRVAVGWVIELRILGVLQSERVHYDTFIVRSMEADSCAGDLVDSSHVQVFYINKGMLPFSSNPSHTLRYAIFSQNHHF